MYVCTCIYIRTIHMACMYSMNSDIGMVEPKTNKLSYGTIQGNKDNKDSPIFISFLQHEAYSSNLYPGCLHLEDVRTGFNLVFLHVAIPTLFA